MKNVIRSLSYVAKKANKPKKKKKKEKSVEAAARRAYWRPERRMVTMRDSYKHLKE